MNPATTNPVSGVSAAASAAFSEFVAGSAQPSAAEVFAAEIAAYRRELPRLLDEGHAERYALCKGNALLSVWDTLRDVMQAGTERFGTEPFFIKKIDPRDPQRFAQLDAQEGRG